MKPLIRRPIVVCILTFLAAAAVYNIENSELIENKNLQSFPNIIDGWKSENIPMEAWVYESLETTDAIMRNYKKDGQTINLAIVWYSDKEIAFHAPEACLGGVGKTVVEQRNIELASDKQKNYKVSKLVVEQQQYKTLVYYYFINEGDITTNQIDLRKMVLYKRLKFQRTSAAFVRIMITLTPNNQNEPSILDSFFYESLPIIKEYTITHHAFTKKQ